MAEEARSYLDPAELSKVSGLQIRARLIVEGSVSGLHKSPYRGASVEFAEHREYVAGDDIRHIDWKVFGRSDRYYIKQYEEETNLRVQLLLDTSESMNYGSGAMSKLEYARTLSAALAYLVLWQQDAIGAFAFDERIRAEVPISSNRSHLQKLVGVLASEAGRDSTDLAAVLGLIAERIKRKSLIILVSDLFDDVDKVTLGLRRLRHAGHDVVLFHTMDPYELEFPFNRMTLFEGLEDQPDQLADPNSLREAYLEEIHNFTRALKRACRNSLIDYQLVDTSRPFDQVLTEYLGRRSGSLS
ncbi:MAG TPA: DUF58 domain-containing protein [Planctomycetes bacterium]|nr:DUF58 domain-containing protein [Planctomycetota bacterium]